MRTSLSDSVGIVAPGQGRPRPTPPGLEGDHRDPGTPPRRRRHPDQRRADRPRGRARTADRLRRRPEPPRAYAPPRRSPGRPRVRAHARAAGRLRGADRLGRGALRGARRDSVGARPRRRGQPRAALGADHARGRRRPGQGGGARLRAARAHRVLDLGRCARRALAEFSLFGLLAGAKTLPRLQALQSERVWGSRWTMGLLSQQTILVVGLGSIGRETARLLAQFGARVLGTSRHEESVEHVDEIVAPSAIADVAGRIDGVVVTLPGTSATEKLVGADFLAALKPGATLVSVGRGTVIDEEALIAALDDGRVGYAALDVVAEEPLADASPLWTHPNVLISPHTAALNAAEDRLIAELFARNATRFLDGEPLVNRVDTVEFY
ncbi:D-2-hydroxyacid dehydrogenase [Rathayibacter oskolensis]|uniref:D-2-hydroxyacid dehydrogenase n=1 Tax=Rathayibacter oskolensis TaxID=1891671 RepID=UPI003466DD76